MQRFGCKPQRLHSRSENARLLFLVSALALVLFSLITIICYWTTKGRSSEAAVLVEKTPEIQTVQILVPTREIPPSTALARSMFTSEQRPLASIPNGAIKAFDELQGYYARTLLLTKQPIVPEMLQSTPPSSEITPQIPEGFRAVAIDVDKIKSVEGWVEPGSRVDVLWITKVRGEPAIKTLIYNAKVLSAARRNRKMEGEQAAIPDTVSLLVSAEDAQKVHLAVTAGSLSLVLRSDGDSSADGPSGVLTFPELYGDAPKDTVLANKGTLTIAGTKWHITEGGELLPSKK